MPRIRKEIKISYLKFTTAIKKLHHPSALTLSLFLSLCVFTMHANNFYRIFRFAVKSTHERICCWLAAAALVVVGGGASAVTLLFCLQFHSHFLPHFFSPCALLCDFHIKKC